ncbi:MAG: endonuclease/exonuclease/phosphatase family protein [Campylobacteraceae bacterium]|nr:endonuclease/exonuclease/phosphatase family protein [Campylobacteraceae bacterium]
MIRVFIFLFFLPLLLLSKEFSVASYNVENFFDLNYNKTEYKEYHPNTKSKWNKKTFQIKLNNIIKVLKDLDADIVALQEIENKELLKLLQKKLPDYKYISFSKYSNASIGLGFLSKIEIINEKSINIKFSNKTYRPILETTFKLNNTEFKIFNNHWPSKRVAESYRIKFAKKLFDRLETLPRDYDYILLGDFNSNYNEYETIYSEKRLNNTNGIIGINHVLNSFVNNHLLTLNDMQNSSKVLHYNPWLELNVKERFSSKFRGRNITADNFLLPFSMFDKKGFAYKYDSFKVFKPKYLYKNKKINRWQMKNKIHIGVGYSDHLPIIAKFTDKAQKKSKNKVLKTIGDLYLVERLNKSITLKNCIVLLKQEDFAIIKQENSRAILIYKNIENLSEGFSYNLEIKQLKTYKGLKEIIDFEIENYNGKVLDYKQFYKKQIDFFDLKNQNEIVKDIKGTYKKGYLYFDNKKIAIYFRNKDFIPKNGSSIMIKRAQLGYYVNKIQLVVFNKSDIINVN